MKIWLAVAAGCALEAPPDPSAPPVRMQEPSNGSVPGDRAIAGPPRARVAVTPLAGGDACSELAIGIDDNGDRALAPGETRARIQVCDVVTIAREPAGPTCPLGGQLLASGEATAVLCAVSLHPLLARADAGPCAVIAAGFDLDGDGVLGDAEIESTAELCAQR